MTFAVTSSPSNEELAEAVNYLLSNFSQTMAINPNTGRITTANYGIVSYLYKYLQVRYADSYDGSVNFSNLPTNRLYYGIQNNDSATESTNPADYLWLPVTGGFGTTKFFWYNTTGGRQIETYIGPVRPSPSFVKDTGNAIDLDLITAAAEDKNDPVAYDYSLQIQALEQAIGSIPQPQLGTMAPLQQDNLPWVTFDTTAENVPPNVGTVAWDGGTTLGVQATANVLIRIGESEFVYAKASAAITKGQLCYHTGSVGASGVITVAPTPLALSDPNQIVGVAAETLAINDFGLIQVSGDLRGFNTTGSSVGETWADGDPLYYNPAYVGSMTKVKPSAPNQKTYLGEVINASSAGSGSMSIRIVPGSILGGTDSNVQFSALANNDIIQYDSTLQYWKNVSLSTAGAVTSVTGTSPVVSSGGTTPAISLATGYGDTKNPYAAKTANYVLAGPTTGASAVPTFRALVAADIPALPYGSGTVTSVSVVSANGFAGTVANSTTTPAITLTTSITGLLKGNGTAMSAATANTDYMGVAAPVTKTTDFTVANGDIWYINNKSGSTCTVTLPAASSWTGRSLTFKNMQAQTLVSASSNVVPIDSTTAGTAILLGVIGNWATMVSDGTNWVIMQAASNNNLLLE